MLRLLADRRHDEVVQLRREVARSAVRRHVLELPAEQAAVEVQGRLRRPCARCPRSTARLRVYSSRCCICLFLRSVDIDARQRMGGLGQFLSSTRREDESDADPGSSPHVALAPPGPARLAGHRAGEQAGGVGPHHPPRHRPAARARLSRRVVDGACRRLHPARRHGDAAAAAGRRRGDSHRRGPQDRRARLGGRDRGGLDSSAREARAGAALPAAPPCGGAGRGDRDSAWRRSHGGPRSTSP